MKNSVSSGGDQMARRVFLEKGIAAVAALVAGLSSTNVEAAAPDPSISKLVAALHAHNPTLAKNFQIADQAFENLLTQIKENGSLDSESDLDEYVRWMYAMQNTLAVSQLDPNTFVRYKSRYEKRMFTALLGVMTNNLSDEIERKHPELSWLSKMKKDIKSWKVPDALGAMVYGFFRLYKVKQLEDTFS